MTLLSERYARRLLTIAAVLCVASIFVHSFAPPSPGGWWGGNLIDAHGIASSQLVLVAIWVALGSASARIRWPCAVAAFWLAVRPLHVASPRLDLWKHYLGWEILPHALLAFTVLSFVRAYGLQVGILNGQPGSTAVARQFSLRKMFAWVAGAAVLTLAWKLLLDSLHADTWPRTFGLKEILIEVASRSVSMTMIDLTVIWITLRRSRLLWRHTSILAIVVLAQTAVWRLADWTVLGRSQPYWQDFIFVCVYDAFYLGPLLSVLLLARAAGYRLTWTGSREE